MPRLSVVFVRAALAYLTLGVTLGALLLVHKGLGVASWTLRLLPAHLECVLFGWTVQLAFGVAFWILPRWYGRYGKTRHAWRALVLLNVGIWLVILTTALGWAPQGVLAGRALEVAAVVAFARHAWDRLTPPAGAPVTASAS